MSFTTMLEQAAQGDQVTILPGWGQGRATFGGVVGSANGAAPAILPR